MNEYDDLLAVWYRYASLDHANPMCVSFRSEQDAIKEGAFFQGVARRLKNGDQWLMKSHTAIEDNPALNEKKGDVRYYVMVQRGK